MKIFHFWCIIEHIRAQYERQITEEKLERVEKKNRLSKGNPRSFPRFSDSRAVYRVARRTGEFPQTRRPVAQVLWRRPASRRRRLCNQYVAALPARPPQPLSPFDSLISASSRPICPILQFIRDIQTPGSSRVIGNFEFLWNISMGRIMPTCKPRELVFGCSALRRPIRRF